jgi:hypothetical protein
MWQVGVASHDIFILDVNVVFCVETWKSKIQSKLNLFQGNKFLILGEDPSLILMKVF